jgi:hypothetical protein
MAEKLALLLYLLGALSLLGLYTNFKNHLRAKLVSILALLVALVAVYFAQATGTSGGSIRHTEIRTGAAAVQAASGNAAEEEKDE